MCGRFIGLLLIIANEKEILHIVHSQSFESNKYNVGC